MRALGVLGILVATANLVGQTAADATAVPPGQTALLTVTGQGVQIYLCRKTGELPAWSFVAPEAKLLDATGVEVGSHGAGPMWSFKDGSSVRGKVVAQQPSPGNIPWLLLQAVDAKGSIDAIGLVDAKGSGTLATVSYIRRSETKGGTARTNGCDAAHLGATDRAPYTATYTFYAAAK